MKLPFLQGKIWLLAFLYDQLMPCILIILFIVFLLPLECKFLEGRDFLFLLCCAVFLAQNRCEIAGRSHWVENQRLELARRQRRWLEEDGGCQSGKSEATKKENQDKCLGLASKNWACIFRCDLKTRVPRVLFQWLSPISPLNHCSVASPCLGFWFLTIVTHWLQYSNKEQVFIHVHSSQTTLLLWRNLSSKTFCSVPEGKIHRSCISEQKTEF